MFYLNMEEKVHPMRSFMIRFKVHMLGKSFFVFFVHVILPGSTYYVCVCLQHPNVLLLKAHPLVQGWNWIRKTRGLLLAGPRLQWRCLSYFDLMAYVNINLMCNAYPIPEVFLQLRLQEVIVFFEHEVMKHGRFLSCLNWYALLRSREEAHPG